jgi:hypothetical protein
MKIAEFEEGLHLTPAIRERTNSRESGHILDEDEKVSPVIFDFNFFAE